MTKIDWTKPIEFLDGTPTSLNERQYFAKGKALHCVTGRDGHSAWHYRDDGTHAYGTKEPIRNVPEVAPKLDLSKPVQTRDGRSVRLITTDGGSGTFPVIGLIAGAEVPQAWRPTGHFFGLDSDGGSCFDLVNVPPVRSVGYRTISAESGVRLGGWHCSTLEEAQRLSGVGNWDGVLAVTVEDGKVVAVELA